LDRAAGRDQRVGKPASRQVHQKIIDHRRIVATLDDIDTDDVSARRAYGRGHCAEYAGSVWGDHSQQICHAPKSVTTRGRGAANVRTATTPRPPARADGRRRTARGRAW